VEGGVFGRSAGRASVDMSSVAKTLSELRRRRDQLRQRLVRIEQAIRALESVADSVGEDESLDLFAPMPGSPSNLLHSRSSGPRPSEVADEVEKLLRERGQPMTRGQIARALVQRGLSLAGTNVNKNVGTILWRHRDRFVNLERMGYWLADVALPGIYEPPATSRQGD
jgi:hypothetical protein